MATHQNSKKMQIAKHLRKYGSIDTIKAIDKYRVTRLAVYILRLRKEGWPIHTTRIPGKRYVNYVLAE